jgi:hypothetical protein
MRTWLFFQRLSIFTAINPCYWHLIGYWHIRAQGIGNKVTWQLHPDPYCPHIIGWEYRALDAGNKFVWQSPPDPCCFLLIGWRARGLDEGNKFVWQSPPYPCLWRLIGCRYVSEQVYATRYRVYWWIISRRLKASVTYRCDQCTNPQVSKYSNGSQNTAKCL